MRSPAIAHELVGLAPEQRAQCRRSGRPTAVVWPRRGRSGVRRSVAGTSRASVPGFAGLVRGRGDAMLRLAPRPLCRAVVQVFTAVAVVPVPRAAADGANRDRDVGGRPRGLAGVCLPGRWEGEAGGLLVSGGRRGCRWRRCLGAGSGGGAGVRVSGWGSWRRSVRVSAGPPSCASCRAVVRSPSISRSRWRWLRLLLVSGGTRRAAAGTAGR